MMKIVHFSDPHAGGPAEDLMAYFDKRWVGVFNYKFRRKFRHDLKLLEKAVEYILDTQPDVAVCTGDLTSTGQPGEFEKVRPILKPLRDSGIPLLYLPGNHDCYVRRPKCVNAVKEMVHYLSRGDYEFGDLPVVREYAGVEFFLYNTSRPSNLLCSWGFVNPRDAAYLSLAASAPKTMPRVLVSHYPLFEDHPFLRFRHRLYRQKTVAALVESGKIDLSLCGHVHRAMLRADALGHGENIAGSVTRNGCMTEITVDQESCRFTFKNIDLKEKN